MAPAAYSQLAAAPGVVRVSLALRVVHVLAYAGLIAVNVGSNLGWFGKTNAEVSAEWPVPITPAGWAFSIWGIIFLLQGAGAAYALLPINYGSASLEKEKAVHAGLWIEGVWASQCFWQIGFAKERFGICLALIFAAVVFASYTGVQLAGARATLKDGFSKLSFLTLSLPTSINGAWLVAACSVQTCIALKSFGMAEGTLQSVGAVLAGVATAGAVAMIMVYKDGAWGATTIWALAAIAENNRSSYMAVWLTCVAGICLVAVAIVGLAFRTARGCAYARAGPPLAQFDASAM